MGLQMNGPNLTDEDVSVETHMCNYWWYFKDENIYFSYDRDNLLDWLNEVPMNRFECETYNEEGYTAVHRDHMSNKGFCLASFVDTDGTLGLAILDVDKEVYTEVNEVSSLHKKRVLEWNNIGKSL